MFLLLLQFLSIRISFPFSNYQAVSCNSGYSLLSCGIDNSQMNNAERARSIIPLSSTSCQCYDYYGAICAIWCYAGPVNNFQIVKYPTTGFLTGTVIATCPTDHTSPDVTQIQMRSCRLWMAIANIIHLRAKHAPVTIPKVYNASPHVPRTSGITK